MPGAGPGVPPPVYLGVASQLREEYRRLWDEVTVDQGEDGKRGDDDGESLPVDEGSKQVDGDQTQTSESCLNLQ